MIPGDCWEPPDGRAIEKAEMTGTSAVISCQQLIEFCLDYIEDALPQDERLRFQRHLAQCADCVTFFETYQKTPQISREALATQIPPSVHAAVRSFLRSRRDP
jgi:anti-sigma factor RsiW